MSGKNRKDVSGSSVDGKRATTASPPPPPPPRSDVVTTMMMMQQTPSPSRLSTEVTMQEFDVGGGGEGAHDVPSQPLLVVEQPTAEVISRQQQDHNDNVMMLTPRRLEPPSETTTTPRRAVASWASSAQQRSSRALKSLHSSVSTTAAAAAVSTSSNNKPKTCNLSEISMICTVAYGGMEVIFGSVPKQQEILALCARTQLVFQALALPECSSNDDDDGKSATIVSLRSNPASGMITVALSDGTVQVYHPVPTSSSAATPSSLNDPSVLTRAFGKYRWVPGARLPCREVFCSSEKGGGEGQEHKERPHVFTPHNVDVSSSRDHKVLVAHARQLAVFDASPGNHFKNAELLWTTRLEDGGGISSATLSGDGRAMVVVVEGEGVANDNPFGVRTFVRDTDDGSALQATAESDKNVISKPESVQRSTSSGTPVGIVYKPGPFLVHSTTVSRISFRGFGNVNSNVRQQDDDDDDEENNDLLLTYCEGDNSVRIFSQNSWKQLMHWTTPPNSRADWVRGISALNLGDLESKKSSSSSSSSRPSSRRPSLGSSAENESFSSADVNAALLRNRTMPLPPSTSQPSTAAGAWIAELTFRNSFPALRLSRLSYMKRGADETQPAHFESVAAILPSSSLAVESLLDSGDVGLSVQGIWSAWPPWASKTASVAQDEHQATFGGSAMAFLGLTTGGPVSSLGMFGDSHQGGTHGPPSELRVVASHPVSGKVVLMEFPLWGDLDFGAMELGNPVRYLLSLSETNGSAVEESMEQSAPPPPPACIDYQSDVLCAQVETGGKSVALTWRRQGTMSVVPASAMSSMSVSSSDSVDSSESYRLFDTQTGAEAPERFQDLSLSPVPLSLPPLRLPKHARISGKEKIVSVHWWRDGGYDCPPFVVVITSSGTLVVHEIPPLWSALEPTMPNFDPFQISRSASAADLTSAADVPSEEEESDKDAGAAAENEYEVMITPHPDFGIGLRLEAQRDGLPAIAGSFKKHPLNGGLLPAERNGMIVLGDELLSVNGVSLEGISFEEIIATVRKIGSESSKGHPMSMRFRPALESRGRISRSFSLSERSHRSDTSGRRTMEQMLGVTPKAPRRKTLNAGEKIGDGEADVDDTISQVSIPPVGGDFEMQQEFSRIVAVIREAVPQPEDSHFLLFSQGEFVGKEVEGRPRAVALVVIATGCAVNVKRLEIPASGDADGAMLEYLGTLTFDQDGPDGQNMKIVNVTALERESESLCFVVSHASGLISLVHCDTEGSGSDSFVKFRHHPIIECVDSLSLQQQRIIRAFSVELLASTIRRDDRFSCINLWTARPLPWLVSKEEDSRKGRHQQEYANFELELDSEHDQVIDFRFVSTGTLDSFPLMVTMTRSMATVYRRDCESFEWRPIIQLHLSALEVPTGQNAAGTDAHSLKSTNICSLDLYPHLMPMLRKLVSACDESFMLRSDWHPDSIIAYLCTETKGVEVALHNNVKGIYKWLARWLDPDDNERPNFNARFPLGVTPLRSLEGHKLLELTYSGEDQLEEKKESSASFMSFSGDAKQSSPPVEAGTALLSSLQQLLCPGLRGNGKDESRTGEGNASISADLPSPLKKLNPDELRVLWAVGEMLAHPPKFKPLDPAAQLTLFCLSVVRTLKTVESREEKETGNNGSRPRTKQSQRSWFSFRPQPESQSDAPDISQIASAGCVSALVSQVQVRLLEGCRLPNAKWDWSFARELRIPLWLRSTAHLKKISEEIGQSTFKDTRDIMESSLFFIIANNTRTLRNLAATDKSDSGRKFFKFITEYDFASERGRKAAEKNAYSLLRKRKYREAASFFLLARPPMLTAALEIIVTQMEDFELAFLTARLVDSSQKEVNAFGSSGIGGGGMGMMGSGGMGLGGMMSGGGGFASVAASDAGIVVEDEEVFDEWVPAIESGTRNLIKSRGLALAERDPCLKALLLIWLGREEEGARCLCGLNCENVWDNDGIAPSSFTSHPISGIPSLIQTHGAQSPFHRPSSQTLAVGSKSANDRVIKKANALIDFTSSPFLLTAMSASARSRWAGTLVVSRALSRRGIELPAARSILQNTGTGDLDGEETQMKKKASTSVRSAEKNQVETIASSILDSFDTPKATPKPASIFSEYDVPTRQAMPPPEVPSSSIFDSFDTPQSRPKAPQPAADAMASSIFDSFDAPPVKQAKRTGMRDTGSEIASSSIFDSFDTAPQKATVATSDSHSQTAVSSIFDAFDNVPPSKQKVRTEDQQTQQRASVQSPASFPPESSPLIEPEDSDVPLLPTPRLWLDFRSTFLHEAVARRLLREIARIIARFHGDAVDAPMKLFRRHVHPLVPSNVGEILHSHCEGQDVWKSTKRSIDDVCHSCRLDKESVTKLALSLVSSDFLPSRIVFLVLIQSAVGRDDLAEGVVREAAAVLIRRCETMALGNDELVDGRKTVHHLASQYLRREAARLSWQLELCLWLHRGEMLPLSRIAIKESITAVRCGLVVASWGRCHECLETMIRCDPDCAMDDEAGHQLWSSLKLIAGIEDTTKNVEKTSSGGWEFLVDCRRDEATELLRSRPCGSFLIRPHSENTDVFTLSFKTNLIPTVNTDKEVIKGSADGEAPVSETPTDKPPRRRSSKPVRKDDVVQHAIIRLSDAGFRCGSFGPFTTLMKLLEAVSSSLPFDLLFSTPPVQGVIKDEGSQPSPNAVFLRKFALTAHTENYRWNGETRDAFDEISRAQAPKTSEHGDSRSAPGSGSCDENREKANEVFLRRKRFGLFLQLQVLSEIRKQLSAVAAAEGDWSTETSSRKMQSQSHSDGDEYMMEIGSVGSLSAEVANVEQAYAIATRIVRPLLCWCRSMEVRCVPELAPGIEEVSASLERPVDFSASETAIELTPVDMGRYIDAGDAAIRRMIQPNSGVEFRTIRVGEGGESAMIVLFSKTEAVNWFVNSGSEKNKADAEARLKMMERRRVIEPIESEDLAVKAISSSSQVDEEKIRYRFVDPWEVEPVESRDHETLGASLGREQFFAFNVSSVARSCEDVFRSMGGLHLLSLWTFAKGGLRLTKAIASVHAPWERDAGGDLQMSEGTVVEPPPFVNSIRQHLYRNVLFRRLHLPQRFLALVQVELLDLKNLTSPGGAPSLSVYALLRLKRPGSTAPLTHKARTLDSSATQPTKVGKSSGPNAPASWGSVVRFRFPLPEDVNCDGVSFDGDREALFKGPPSVLQISVYEKKFMSDILLGGADIALDALASGGQMEEWVPLRATKQGGSGTGGISWFVRMRLTLRFELLCLESDDDLTVERPPSVGLRKIQQLSKLGGAYEDTKQVKLAKRSESTSDLLSYIESMVY